MVRGMAFWKAIWSGTDTKRCFIQQSTSDTIAAQTWSWSKPKTFWNLPRGICSFENEKCLMLSPSPNTPIHCVDVHTFFFPPDAKWDLEPPACPTKTIKQLRRKGHSLAAIAMLASEPETTQHTTPPPQKTLWAPLMLAVCQLRSYLCICWGKPRSIWHQS